MPLNGTNAPAPNRAAEATLSAEELRIRLLASEQRCKVFIELGRQLAAAHTPQVAAQAIATAAQSLLGFDAALLHLLTPDQQYVLRVLTLDTIAGELRDVSGPYRAESPSPTVLRTLREGPVLIARRAAGDNPELIPFGASSRASASLVFVPIRTGGEAVGILSIQSYTPDAYQPASVELLQSLADYAGAGFARLRTQFTSDRLALMLNEAQRVARLGSYESDLRTGVDHWSDEGFRQLGYEPGEVPPGREAYYARVHPEDRDRVQRAVEDLSRTGNGLEHEYRVLLPGGEVRHLRAVGGAEKDETGRVIRLYGAAQDITDRKRAEAELREIQQQLERRVEERTQELVRINAALVKEVQDRKTAEAYLRTLVDSTPDWIFIKDTQFRFQLVNRSMAEALHRSPADFVGKDDINIGMQPELVLGDPAQGLRGFRADDREVMETGRAKIIAEEPNVVDGLPVFLNTIKVPLRDATGKVTGLLGYVRDITERKAVEAERERLITELQTALAEVKTLSGLLPICGWCKKVRDDSGYWANVEVYLKRSSGAEITHGICPECSKKAMADLENEASSEPDTPPPAV